MVGKGYEPIFSSSEYQLINTCKIVNDFTNYARKSVFFIRTQFSIGIKKLKELKADFFKA